MRTDVVLESDDRRIILDTKFYAEALRGRYETKKVDSGHLYQIFAYVENRTATLPGSPPHEGILLYPVVEDASRSTIGCNGHRIGVRSLDLDQPWGGIREDLLRLLS
jgi:5-methylcytosine-specific restriction enzyme subunit McrC